MRGWALLKRGGALGPTIRYSLICESFIMTTKAGNIRISYGVKYAGWLDKGLYRPNDTQN